MQRPEMNVAVVMRRRKLDNPWQSELWEVAAVLAPYHGPDAAAEPVAGRRTPRTGFIRGSSWSFTATRARAIT